MDTIIARDQIKAISDELGLQEVCLLSDLIESSLRKRKEELLVRMVFTSSESYCSFLKEHLNIELAVSSLRLCNLTLTYGTDEKNLLEYDSGMVRVEADSLNTYLLSLTEGTANISMVRADPKLQGIRLELMYVEDYTRLSPDEWRAYLIESEYLVLVLNAGYLFPETEQLFFDTYVNSIFSESRCCLLLGNAGWVKLDEWKSVHHRIKMYAGDRLSLSPLFSPAESAFKDKYERLFGKTKSIDEICSGIRSNAINIRNEHTKDCDKLLRAFFVSKITGLRAELESEQLAIAHSIRLLSDIKVKMRQSAERTVNQAKLSIDTVAKYLLQEKIKSFASVLKKALTEDIRRSENIREEIKSVNLYIEAMWNSFFDDQNLWMQDVLRKEIENITRMIRLDFQDVAREFDSQLVREQVLTSLEHEIAAIAYIRKKRSGMGTEAFADCLTVGGIVVAFFVPMVGLMTFLSSFIIRLSQKKKIDEELKESFISNMTEDFDKVTAQILAQSGRQYAEILKSLEAGIQTAYNHIIDNTQQALIEIQKKQVFIKENMKLIDNI